MAILYVSGSPNCLSTTGDGTVALICLTSRALDNISSLAPSPTLWADRRDDGGQTARKGRNVAVKEQRSNKLDSRLGTYSGKKTDIFKVVDQRQSSFL